MLLTQLSAVVRGLLLPTECLFRLNRSSQQGLVQSRCHRTSTRKEIAVVARRVFPLGLELELALQRRCLKTRQSSFLARLLRHRIITQYTTRTGRR